ncbi:MAG: hypothetical protein AB1591_02600 [Pseudomonadota bacterium]
MKRSGKTYFVARDSVAEGGQKVLGYRLSTALHSRYQARKAHKRLLARFPDAYMVESRRYR